MFSHNEIALDRAGAHRYLINVKTKQKMSFCPYMWKREALKTLRKKQLVANKDKALSLA